MSDYKIHTPVNYRAHQTIQNSLIEFKGIIGLDIEFTGGGIYAPNASVRLVQFSTITDSYVLDMQYPFHRSLAKDVFIRQDLKFVAHNASGAEIPAIFRFFDVDISSRTFDTLTLALLAWPGEQSKHGLKDLAPNVGALGLDLISAQHALNSRFEEIYVGESRKSADVQEFGWTNISSRDPAYLRYAALDALVVRRLLPVLFEELKARGISKETINRELSINAISARMSIRGWRVDPERATHLLDTIGKRNADAMTRFETKSGIKARSPKRAAYLAAQGVQFTQFTDKGAPRLSKEALRELVGLYPDNEDLQTLLEVAETANVVLFLNTLKGFIDDSQTVHPDIRTLGAVSGRWTITRPALQTVGAKSGTRSVFVPREEGHVILSADLSAIEPRVAFALAGAQSMLELMKQGADAYGAAATLVFGEGYSAFQRKLTKRIILGSLYGAGVNTLTKQAKYLDGWQDANEQAIAEARQQFWAAVPEIKQMGYWLQEQPDVRLPSGRYAPHDPNRLYRATNSLVQGAARDVLMTRMLDLCDLGLEPYMLLTMHDEILFSVPASELREVAEKIQSVMTQGFEGVPTPSDLEVYLNNWAEMPLSVDEACGRLGI